jgi:hypothetical protein
VFQDALVQPPPGQALVRFIEAAPEVPAVDVRAAGGQLLAAAVAYPTATDYVPIAPGQYDVNVLAAGTPDVLLRISGWSIDPGVQSSVIVVEGLDGNLDVAPVVDSATVASMPVGAVQTGYGGMAPDPQPSLVSARLYGVAAVVTVSVLAALAYRRRVSAAPR